MKIRSIKLREAHKNNESKSYCSIIWDHQAQHLITASSSDTSISIHDPLLLSSSPKILRHHRDGVTALAISPNSTCLASGSIDHSVKLYKFPAGEFQTNITRFTLPIRCIAFNKSGSMLGASGDDEGIKLIDTVDGTISRVLKGHKGPVTGLAFDPNGEYLASVDSTGTVIFWELQSGRALHTLKGVAPNIGSEYSIMNILGWSPDGETLAVPGLRNDVVMYDRDTSEKLFTLRGDHTEPVCFVSWSPNGKYIATSSSDKQVLIWDVDQRQDIDRQKFDDKVCCMAWKPIGNALAVIDVTGKYGIWDSVITSSMKTPTEDIPILPFKNSNGLVFGDDEEDEKCSSSGSLGDLGEDESETELELSSRKRLRKQSAFEESLEEDVRSELHSIPCDESRKKSRRAPKEMSDGGREGSGCVASMKPNLQEAFQSGATPVQPGKKRFLFYSMLGSITTIEHAGYSHIEIDFHDTSRGPRVPSMTDHYGFTMASMNEKGSVFANPCKGEKNISTLMYRPFSSWASNSEWSARLEGEEVKVVALGTSWVAAVTSLNFLRIFTEGGLQMQRLEYNLFSSSEPAYPLYGAYAVVGTKTRFFMNSNVADNIKISIISLAGPVVTATGSNDELVVVTHTSLCQHSNDQMLEFQVFNIAKLTSSFKGGLPLTPGSTLSWFGFSEEGQLTCYDSKGVLRVFINQFGGSWVPVFSARKEKSDESYWVVGLNATKMFCIVCKNPNPYPQVMPKPVLTLVDLSFPIASSDLDAQALEKEFIMNNMQISQMKHRIEESASAGLDTSLPEDEAFDMEAAQDKCIMRLLGLSCNGDKLLRATELVKLLSLDRSVKGAIILATGKKLPHLAERFNNILEERMLKAKTEDDVAAPLLSSNHALHVRADTAVNNNFTHRGNRTVSPISSNHDVPVRADYSVNDTFTSSESTKISEHAPVLSLQPKLTSPLFRKKAKLHEPQLVKEKAKVDDQAPVKMKNLEDISEVKEVQQSIRPSNPFAKSSSSSNSQNNLSLVDSLKKMNNTNNAAKR